MTKEKIDIEALLVWAYRERQVDKVLTANPERVVPPSYLSPSEAIRRQGELGVRVDTSGPREIPVTHIIGERDADALTLHDAVMRLDDFYAEFQTESRVRLWTVEAAETAGGAILATGTGAHRQFQIRLPKRSPRHLRPISALALVVAHARAGIRPDWHSEWKAPRRGSRAIPGSLDAYGRKRKGDAGLEERETAIARAAYQVWIMSLEWLAAELTDGLSVFEVTGPLAESEPWQLDMVA